MATISQNLSSQTRKISTRLVPDLQPEHFRLPDDKQGKQEYLCHERSNVLVRLAAVGNSDGTHIEVAAGTIAKKLGCSRHTVFDRLDDLKRLHFLVDDGLVGQRQARRRHLNLQRIAEVLGVAVNRPVNLPAFIPSDLWQRFAQVIGENKSVDDIVWRLHHDVHISLDWTDQKRAEAITLENMEHSIRLGFISNEILGNDMLYCSVKGCPLFVDETTMPVPPSQDIYAS